VSADRPSDVAAAAERLHAATTVNELLSRAAESFVTMLDAQACTISRVIGDLLVDLVQHQRSGKPDRLGHGYLISDYPLTRAAIESREPQTVYTGDAEADESEIKLLAELGFDSLLMLAIESKQTAWALVEVYGNGRRFGPEDVDRARALAGDAGDALERLSRPAQ
jgi:GAF domain-containing protein